MSGIEIAGLVLGGFPLLISAAEHYKEGFEPLLKWKRFRREFISFIDAVDIEKQLFVNAIQRYLMTADIPEDEIQAFMTIPDYEGWHRDNIVKGLQSRLGPAYQAFISTISVIGGLIEDLKALLLLKNGDVNWAKEGERMWDYQMKRIQLSFSKKRERTLSELEKHNRKLRDLLDSTDKLDGVRAARKDTTWASIFQCIRHSATNLHTALKSSWTCDCTLPHTAALHLQKHSTGGWTSSFNMEFSIPGRNPRTRRKVLINIPDDQKEIDKVAHASPKMSDEYLVHLRHDFDPKSFARANVALNPDPRSPSTSETTIKAASHTSSAISTLKDFFATKNESFTNAKTTLNSNGTQSTLSMRSKKPIKSARFEIPMESTIQQVEPATKTQEAAPRTKIDDLCSTLGSDAQIPCLGYIIDNEQRQYELHPLNDSQLPEFSDVYEVINLEALLKSGSQTKLNRQERYLIASTLASSFLQLQSTPWLAKNMAKSNIFFLKHGSKILVEQPFINHNFVSTKILESFDEAFTLPAAKRSAVRKSLNQLGVLLLELCFGQAIEDQKLWKDHLGSDGREHRDTDYLTAIDWSEEVMSEEPEFQPIINCCIFSVFQEKTDWENKQFVQAVYSSIIEPLERFASKWDSTYF